MFYVYVCVTRQSRDAHPIFHSLMRFHSSTVGNVKRKRANISQRVRLLNCRKDRELIDRFDNSDRKAFIAKYDRDIYFFCPYISHI